GQPVHRPNRQQPTWYENAARQVHPDNTDFGLSWEQRKQEFINQLRNPCFRFGLATTGASVLLIVTLSASYVKHRRVVEFAAESIADLQRHNEYAGRVAC